MYGKAYILVSRIIKMFLYGKAYKRKSFFNLVLWNIDVV